MGMRLQADIGAANVPSMRASDGDGSGAGDEAVHGVEQEVGDGTGHGNGRWTEDGA